jgi:AP-3 complex subunit delta-1
VRKKATLCTYPLFLNFPEALRPAFPRLKVGRWRRRCQQRRAKGIPATMAVFPPSGLIICVQDKLDDEVPSVQSASVSVICELARKNPKNYLSLAPTFFKILNNSQNNWMRIKIIKLFAALCPLVSNSCCGDSHNHNHNRCF